MVSFLKEWAEFESEIKRAKEVYNRVAEQEKNEILINIKKKRYKELMLASCGHIAYFEYFENNYGYKKENLKQFISPFSKLFLLTEKEQIKMFDYYIYILGSVDIFLQLVNKECVYYMRPFIVETGIFTYKDRKEINFRIKEIAAYFNISRENVIEMMCGTGVLSSSTIKDIERKVCMISETLGVEIEEVKRYCIRYPFILEKHVPKLAVDIERIANYFCITTNRIINCIKKYPPFLLNNITSVSSTNLKEIDEKKPWIINLSEKCNAYLNLQKIIYEIVEDVEKVCGTVEDAGVIYYKTCKPTECDIKSIVPFAYIIVKALKKEVGYYIIGVGDDKQQVEIIKKSFIRPVRKNNYQFRNFNGHKCYIAEIKSPLIDLEKNLADMIAARIYDVVPCIKGYARN